MPNVGQVCPNLMPPTGVDLHDYDAELIFWVSTECIMPKSGEPRLRRFALLHHPACPAAFSMEMEHLGIDQTKVRGKPAMYSNGVLTLEATRVQLPHEAMVSAECFAYEKQP